MSLYVKLTLPDVKLLGRTCFSTASFYSCWKRFALTPQLSFLVFVPECFLWITPGCDHLIEHLYSVSPSLQIPAALCSLTIRGTFIVSRISFTDCALRSESSEQQMSFKKMPAAIWKSAFHAFYSDPIFYVWVFFFIRLEFGWAEF